MHPPLAPTHLAPNFTALGATGLSLLEILLVLSVLALLMRLAAPSWQALQARWKLQQATDALSASLMFARSEAIRRGGRLGLQKLSATDDCTASAEPQDWSCGWLVFADHNRDGRRQPGEPALQQIRLSGEIDIYHRLSGSGADHIGIDRYGMLSGRHNRSWTLTHSQQPEQVRTLCLSSGGRMRILARSNCP